MALSAPWLRNPGRYNIQFIVNTESSHWLSSVNTVKKCIKNSNEFQVLLEWVNVRIYSLGFGPWIAKKGMFIFLSSFLFSPPCTCTILHLQCIVYWFSPAPLYQSGFNKTTHVAFKKKSIRMLMVCSTDLASLEWCVWTHRHVGVFVYVFASTFSLRRKKTTFILMVLGSKVGGKQGECANRGTVG